MLPIGIISKQQQQYKSKFPPSPSQSAYHLKITLGGLAMLEQGQQKVSIRRSSAEIVITFNSQSAAVGTDTRQPLGGMQRKAALF